MCALSRASVVAQGDLVRPGDVTGLNSPQPFTQSFASLPQELQRVAGGALRSGAIRISPVLLDEVCLKRRSDFVSCLQRLVDSPVPCGVVNHAASITRTCFAMQRRGMHPGKYPRGHDGHAAATCVPNRARVRPASASAADGARAWVNWMAACLSQLAGGEDRRSRRIG